MKRISALIVAIAMTTTSLFGEPAQATEQPPPCKTYISQPACSSSSWPKWTAAIAVLAAIGIGVGIAVSQSK